VRSSLRNSPGAVATSRSFVSTTVGRKFACGLDGDGTAYCWGENGRGQLGQTDTLGRAAATRVGGSVRFTSLAAGFWHVCGLSTDQAVYCWGDNTYGELATGDTLSVTGPHRVSGTAAFKFLTSGSIHSCGIATNGHTLCWGANFSGQLGDGTNSRHLTPSETAVGLTFVSLAAERANSILSHTCGLTAAGDVYCWGWNSKSQLGTSQTVDACQDLNGGLSFSCSHDPVKVAGISNVSRIDAGLEHTCAISGTSVYCWGDNTFGALGDGTGVTQPAPVAVKGGLQVP
jgi:alpha-tubulin suppressor-like RCC1 family protein